MKFYNEQIQIKTHRHCELVDITGEVQKAIQKAGIKNGTAIVFCPHTTAGITTNENADPSVVDDILLTLAELIPQHRSGYRHSEGNSDAHVKSSLVGASEQILIQNGSAVLGTWQGIYFCEFDGPRNRKAHIRIQGE